MTWPTILTLATPFLVLAIKFLLQQRPNLQAYFSNISSFTVADAEPENRIINHHKVIVTNVGHRAAMNVRLRHVALPRDFNVRPHGGHTVERQDDGSAEIVIPRLRPNEWVEIAYMYGSEITYDRIHDGIVHDDGFAKHIDVIQLRQFPAWYNRLAAMFALAGLMLTVYWAVRGGMWAWQFMSQ